MLEEAWTSALLNLACGHGEQDVNTVAPLSEQNRSLASVTVCTLVRLSVTARPFLELDPTRRTANALLSRNFNCWAWLATVGAGSAP